MKKISLLLIVLSLLGLFACSSGEIGGSGGQNQLGATEQVDNKTDPLYIIPYSYCAQYGLWDSFGENPNGPSPGWQPWVTGTGSANILGNSSISKYPPYVARLRSYATDPVGSFSLMDKQFDAFNTGSYWLNPQCSSFHEQNTHTEPATACLVYAWFKPAVPGTNHVALQIIDAASYYYLDVVEFTMPTTSGWQEFASHLIPNCPQKIVVRIGVDGQSWVMVDDVYINWFY